MAPLRGVFVREQRHELDVSVSLRRPVLAPLGDVAVGRSLQRQQ